MERMSLLATGANAFFVVAFPGDALDVGDAAVALGDEWRNFGHGAGDGGRGRRSGWGGRDADDVAEGVDAVHGDGVGGCRREDVLADEAVAAGEGGILALDDARRTDLALV